MIASRPANPCRKQGVDCPLRRLGCRTTCEEWIKYEKEYGEWHRQRTEAMKQKGHIIEYNKHSRHRRRH